MFRVVAPSVLGLALVLSAACDGGGTDDEAAAGDRQRATPKKPNHGVKVDSLWREKANTPGKQTVAILSDDVYSHSDQFLMFGDKGGAQRIRSFVGLFSIIASAGSVEKAEDDFYQLTATFQSKALMKIKLVGRDGTTFDLTYERVEDDNALRAQAVAAADKFYEKFDKLLEKGVDTLSDLKAFANLHIRSHDFAPNDDRALAWQFATEPFQIEGTVSLSAPKKSLAGVAINFNGKDAISKHFKKEFGMDWTDAADVPAPEDVFATLGDNPNVPAFLTFEKKITGVEAGPIRTGLKKFADFTIKVMNPFECEGSFDYVSDYHWVLEDGSILSYTTTPECD